MSTLNITSLYKASIRFLEAAKAAFSHPPLKETPNCTTRSASPFAAELLLAVNLVVKRLNISHYNRMESFIFYAEGEHYITVHY